MVFFGAVGIALIICFFYILNDNKKKGVQTPKKAFNMLYVGIAIFLIFIVALPFTLSSSKDDVKSSSSATSSSKSDTSKNDADIKALNDWLKNNYANEQSDAYQKDNEQFVGTKEYVMLTAISGFKVESHDLTVVISDNRLKAENLTQKDVANYAFNVVIGDYKGKLPSADNLKNDGSLKDEVVKKPLYYSELN